MRGAAAAAAVVQAIKAAMAPVVADLATLQTRVLAIEARAPVPGPRGEKGERGDRGERGAPGVQYLGVWVANKTYERGDLATWRGSTWHCNDTTDRRPGDGSAAWTLMVKSADRRDARREIEALVARLEKLEATVGGR